VIAYWDEHTVLIACGQKSGQVGITRGEQPNH
jgi:hypothetical protein